MESLMGGVIIGLAVSLLLLFNGRVSGISGIVGGVLQRKTLDKSWRVLFVIGLLIGGMILRFMRPETFSVISDAQTFDYMLAGFLVGFGTLLGNGCTSGHGVCGISRFSMRSIVATVTFILSGIASVLLFRILKGEL